MNASIINIGDELLIGDTVNTNASWMARILDGFSVHIRSVYVVSDEESDIVKHLDYALFESDLVLITGGLGPTHDDITKHTLCRYFKDDLVFNEAVYAHLESLLKSFGKEVNALNKTQAYLPSNCQPWMNFKGTAPGMLFNYNAKNIVSMPGVPREMKHLVKRYLIPLLETQKGLVQKRHRYIKTFGIPESELAEQLAPVLGNLDSALKIAFLPSPAFVKIRITQIDNADSDSGKLIAVEKRIIQLLGDGIYGYDGDELEGVLAQLLIQKGKSVSTAESCTGGQLAGKLTSIAGSSAYFKGSIVAYHNDVKESVLDVSKSDLEEFGAVSEQVVSQMAVGVMNLMNSDFGLATSGIAGPDGGTPEKPVGTIWIAISGPNGIWTKKLQLGYSRAINISVTASSLLNELRKDLLKNF